MSQYARNIAVGTTVIVALMLLCGMILLFTGLPQIFQRGYEIYILADTTHDAHEGDVVHIAGMRIGRITRIGFADPDRPSAGVRFTARIDPDVKLMGNARAHFLTKGMIGAAYIEIKADGPPRYDQDGRQLVFFPTDGSIDMDSLHVGRGLIPDELKDAMKSLSRLAENVNQLIAPAPEPTVTPVRPDQAQAVTAPARSDESSLRGTIGKLNRALDALSTVLGDVENQQNIKDSLGNLSKATAAAKRAMTSLEKFADEARRTASEAGTTAKNFSKLAIKSQQQIENLSANLIRNTEEISKLMGTINRAAARVESGEGTVGKLLNDPELYNALLQATRQMSQLMGEFRQLVEAWRKGGVEIKVK